MILYFDSDVGCGLEEARDLESGKRAIIRETGTENYPRNIHKATEEEIAWVEGMGGWVTDSCKTKKDSGT